MFNKGNCDHEGKLQAPMWCIIYKDEESVLVAFFFPFPSYYLNSSGERKINVALYFIEFLGVTREHSGKQSVTKASSQFGKVALSQSYSSQDHKAV